MSKRLGQPKPSATARTIRRWLDPMNRTVLNSHTKKYIPSKNPDCTRGRNHKRFDKRKLV